MCRLAVVVTVVSWLAMAGVCHASRLALSADDPRAAFFDVVTGAVPRRGAVEAIFAGPGGRWEQRVGFDFATGAWFRASDRVAQGRQPDGTEYFGDAGFGRGEILDPTAEIREVVIADFIPAVWLYVLSRHPDVVESVERTATGFVAAVRMPDAGGSSGPRIALETDHRGRVTRVWREDLGPSRREPITYREDGPEFAPLPDALADTGLRLMTFTADDGDAERFSRERVEALGAYLQLRAAQADAGGAAGADSQSGSQSGARLPPRAPGPADRWRLPLIVAGIVFVAIGAGAIIRSRRR